MKKYLPLLILNLILSSCGVSKYPVSNSTVAAVSLDPGATEPAARIIFHKNNFTELETFVTPVTTTNYGCVGDNLKIHKIEGSDFSSTPIAFDTKSGDDLLPTYRPSFLKHVSVDITNSYFLDKTSFPITLSPLASDTCSYREVMGAAQTSYCADFDRTPFVTALPAGAPNPTGAATPTPAPTPDWLAHAELDPFFGTGYYRVRDDWCVAQGPIIDPDVETTKTHVGGANIDIDRTNLGAAEDLLVNVTYQAFNNNNYAGQWPNINNATEIAHHTVLKVQMIGTGQSLATLLGVKQPRAWGYYESSSYPVYAKEISTFDDPYGGMRTEQVYVPLSQYPLVDRIRIERVRGSYILYEVDVYRLGDRSASAN